MFKTILVPVDIDDAETSRPALDKAVALAEGSGGTLRVIYVRSLVPTSFMEFVPPHFDTAQQGDAERRLAALAQGVRLPQERVSSVVTMGGVYHDVLQEAEKIGGHGRAVRADHDEIGADLVRLLQDVVIDAAHGDDAGHAFPR